MTCSLLILFNGLLAGVEITSIFFLAIILLGSVVLVGVFHVRWQMLTVVALRPPCSKEVLIFKKGQVLADVIGARFLQYCGLSCLRRVGI